MSDAEVKEEKKEEKIEEKKNLEVQEMQDKAEEKAAAEQEVTAKPDIQIPLAPRCENPIIGGFSTSR